MALVIAVAALALLAPQIRTWLTSYEGVVLRTDTETVKWSSKKGPGGRRARVYKIEVGAAEGEPFWATVDEALYGQLKIGSFVRKGYFSEQPEAVDRLENLAALRARYSWVGETSPKGKQSRKAGPTAGEAGEPEEPESETEDELDEP